VSFITCYPVKAKGADSVLASDSRLDLMTGHLDELAQGFVDGVVVTEYFSYIWVNLDEVRASIEALDVLASDAAFHPGEVILGTEVICVYIILLHSHVALVASLYAR